MESVVDDGQISYALEKIGDFIRNSGTGAIPAYSDTATKIIIDSLLAFQEKAAKFGVTPDEYDFENIKYAVCELQGFVTGDKSDVANRRAANVYLGFLGTKIEELREREREIEKS